MGVAFGKKRYLVSPVVIELYCSYRSMECHSLRLGDEQILTTGRSIDWK